MITIKTDEGKTLEYFFGEIIDESIFDGECDEGSIVVNKDGELRVVANGSLEKFSYNDSLQYYDTSYKDALESYKSLESKRDELIGHLDSLAGYLRLNNVSIDFILKNLEKLEISLFEFKLKLEGSVGE